MNWKRIKSPRDLPDEDETVVVRVNGKEYSAKLITNEFRETVWEVTIPVQRETVWEVTIPVQFAPLANIPKQQQEQLGIETEFNLPAPTHWRKP